MCGYHDAQRLWAFDEQNFYTTYPEIAEGDQIYILQRDDNKKTHYLIGLFSVKKRIETDCSFSDLLGGVLSYKFQLELEVIHKPQKPVSLASLPWYTYGTIFVFFTITRNVKPLPDFLPCESSFDQLLSNSVGIDG